MNAFYWKMVNHKPNPIFYQFYTKEELGIKTVNNESKQDNQSNKICDISNSNDDKQLESLKLMGFKRETILLIQSEYAKDVIEKTLNYLKSIDEINDPKATFLSEINRFK
jgi:hypothetical protein